VTRQRHQDRDGWVISSEQSHEPLGDKVTGHRVQERMRAMNRKESGSGPAALG
jgi:hypothetical protein